VRIIFDKYFFILFDNLLQIRLIDLVERELNMKLSTKIKIIEFAVMCSDLSDNYLPDLPRIRITI
jgi:5'-3' exonuclease